MKIHFFTKNDPTLKRDVAAILNENDARTALRNFIQSLEEFQLYSIGVLSVPFQFHIQVLILCLKRMKYYNK